MDDLPVYAGFDREVLAALFEEQRSFYVLVSVLAAAASVIVGLGMLYGGSAATGSVLLGLLLGVGSVLVVGNLYRLLNAASGFPLHESLARLEVWRPGIASSVVLFALGVMLMQPAVLALMWVVHQKSGGLITEGLATWRHPFLAGTLTTLLSLLMSAPAWLRFFFKDAVRAYERERWLQQRAVVDEAYGTAQQVIEEALTVQPTFTGLERHFGDPPYNTRPLLFGFDPELLEREGVRFVKPAKRIADEREVEREEVAAPSAATSDEALEAFKRAAQQADEAMARAEALEREQARPEEAPAEPSSEEPSSEEPSSEEPSSEEPSSEEPPLDEQAAETEQPPDDAAEEASAEPPQPEPEPEPEPEQTPADEEADDGEAPEDEPADEPADEVAPEAPPVEEKADDAIDEADDLFGHDDEDDHEDDDERPPPPPSLHYLDIGRMTPARARKHIDEVAPFIASLTQRDEAVVRGLIRAAPDDLPMHRLFSEWKSLSSILLHNAGFALDANMASVISIAVGRPTDEVIERLKAAPRDRRLSGVFAPELAQKLLGKKI